MTNRELYLAIDDIIKRNKSSDRTLEQYLSALLVLAKRQSNSDCLPVGSFEQLLTNAFTAEPLSFEENWRTQSTPLTAQVLGYAGWEATLTRQILDLREMDEIGSLKNDLRYFGIKAPRGSYWFNFDPATFLECGMAGTFGGWEEGDSTERAYVEDHGAVPDDRTVIVSPGPDHVGNPVAEVPVVSWEQFQKFLECGQQYE